MRRSLAVIALGSSTCVLEGGEVQVGKHLFTVPDGFEIELAAGPPLVDRPIVADYDEAGHLYVADSAGVNDKVQKQLEERPHRIVRLTDVDGDGVYDKSVVFADKMMFPEGLLWHDGAVYCAAPPSIWKLEDLDDDGVADRRTEWFNVGTLTGCANDLHGPYLGPAGWIYWTKGAFAKLDLEMGDGSRLTDSAAHIFRARPDGSGLESYAAGGMDNPVDVTFGEAGDAFFSSTFLVHPAQGRRDGLIHSIYGSVYPKKHGVIDGLPRTGPLMPAMSHLGPSASCGLATYRSEVFGSEFRGNLFSCLFNMRKVVRHRLTASGATYQSEDSDFVVSDQVDFHPTDVQEDADGSLLVLDTGGWYKLCCPTSVIAKPEVLGGIYRVRRSGVKAPADPRGVKIDWPNLGVSELAELLENPRPEVRDRAIIRLAQKGDDALPVLRTALGQGANQERALGAVWALARKRTAESAAVLRLALRSSIASVQQAGAYACGLERDAGSFSALVKLLESPHPAVRREAATALGRLGKQDACGALLTCEGADFALEHAVIYALIEINAPEVMREFLPGKDKSGRVPYDTNRVLWSLDAMPGDHLRAEDVVALLGNETPVLPILQRHPEWGKEVAGYYEKFLRKETVLGDREGRMDHCLNEFLHWPEVGKMVSDLLLEGSLHQAAVRHIGDGPRPDPLPDTLIPGLEKALMDGQLKGTPLLQQFQPRQLTPKFEQWLTERSQSDKEEHQFSGRWAAELLARCNRPLPPKAFDRYLSAVGDAGNWQTAAEGLTSAKLNEEQKLALADALPKAGVVELATLLKLYEAGGSEQLGKQLARALVKSPARQSISSETFAKVAKAFPEAVRPLILDARPARIDEAATAARLKELETTLPAGDRKRGHQVFRSSKGACATCHRVAYDGGDFGPDLTRIGAIRSRRDLLEAIVAPSASYARGYEPMLARLESGESMLGILKRDGKGLRLRDLTGREEPLGNWELERLQVAPVSLMPAGLDQGLTSQQLADLIAFLQSLK